MSAVELTGGLGAVALFAVPGYGLTELLPPLRRLPAARRIAYGYLLGVAAVAGGLYFLSHALGVPLRPPVVWTTAALPALAGLAAGLARRPALRFQPAARLAAWVRGVGGPIQATCTLVAALVCAGVLAEAVSNPVHDWDGRITWSLQARYIRDAGSVDAEVLRDARWYVSHPQYPLLLPIAQAAALEAFHADLYSHLQRALYAAFFPALLLLVYDGARRGAGPTAAALTVLAAAAIPFLAYGEGGAFSTYSDLPLACFYGGAVVLLLGPRPTAASGLAAGLLLAAAALAKNEGSLLAVLALALGWRSGRRPGRRPALVRISRTRPSRGAANGPGSKARDSSTTEAYSKYVEGVEPSATPETGPFPVPQQEACEKCGLALAAAALPLLLALLLLASWRSGIPDRQDENYPEMVRDVQLWPGILTHSAVYAPVLVRQMSRFHHWAGFWWMAPVVLLAGRHAFAHPRNRRYLLTAAAPPAIGLAAYSIHRNPGFLAAVTWERLLLQGAVPLLILVACALAEVHRQLLRRRARIGGLPEHDPDLVETVLDEGDVGDAVRGDRQLGAVELGAGDAAGRAVGVLDADGVARGVIAEGDLVPGPGAGDGGIDR
jgi:hypothetical protein